MSTEDNDEELTRKQRREQARVERRALEEAQAAGASRRRRMQLLGGTVGTVVLAIVIVLVATSGSSSKAPPKEGSKEATKITSEISALVGGIRQTGNVLGNPTAPVTLVYFGDLECPVCREFTLGALQSLIHRWVRGGDLRVEYRSLETASREPETFKKQQVAALAAGRQEKMWNFIETFYHEQGEENSGYVTESFLAGIAKQVPGLNLAQWQAARGDSKLLSQVEEDAQAANNQGFAATPSFLIGHTGGATSKLEYSSLTDPTTFNEAIEKALKA